MELGRLGNLQKDCVTCRPELAPHELVSQETASGGLFLGARCQLICLCCSLPWHKGPHFTGILLARMQRVGFLSE